MTVTSGGRVVGRATGQTGTGSREATDREDAAQHLGGFIGSTMIDCGLVPHRMARRRQTNYKQVETGTVDLGASGAQVHIASIRMIDAALRGAFLNNVQFSVMDNGGRPAENLSQIPAFTMYLSYADTSPGWSDASVIAVFTTPAGGGNGNLVCKRTIKTNDMTSTVGEQVGPVHVWLEGTDVLGTLSARVTLTSWGRMIILTEDF